MASLNLDPSKVYMVSGATLSKILARQDKLWNGDNIQRGLGVLKRAAGSAGYSLGVIPPAPDLPTSPSSQPFPYQGTDASDTTSGKVTVRYGTHNGVPPTIDGTALLPPAGTPIPKLALGTDAQIVYVEFDGAFDATGAITSYTGNTINSSNSPTAPANSLTFASDGSGTFSFYQILFAVSVTAPAAPGGSYSVAISPNVQNSQTFWICGTQISYGIEASAV